MFIIQPGVFPMLSYVDTRRFAYGDGHLYFTGMNFSLEQQRTSSSLVIYPFASRDFAVKDPTPGVLPIPGPEKYTHMHTFFGSQGGNRTYLGGIGHWDQVCFVMEEKDGVYIFFVLLAGKYKTGTTRSKQN
jgi:hypothetical protein